MQDKLICIKLDVHKTQFFLSNKKPKYFEFRHLLAYLNAL